LDVPQSGSAVTAGSLVAALLLLGRSGSLVARLLEGLPRYCLSMAQANVEVIRRLFDSYRRGDYAEAAECLAAHIVWEVGEELPARGPEEVRAMWERWDDAWDEQETVPEEFIDAGQHVLVTVHYSARGRGSGIRYEERLFDVYTFSDGECVRKQEFRQRSKALDAAGLDS
jgi:ketosteroid isomerase-like protein